MRDLRPRAANQPPSIRSTKKVSKPGQKMYSYIFPKGFFLNGECRTDFQLVYGFSTRLFARVFFCWSEKRQHRNYLFESRCRKRVTVWNRIYSWIFKSVMPVIRVCSDGSHYAPQYIRIITLSRNINWKAEIIRENYLSRLTCAPVPRMKLWNRVEFIVKIFHQSSEFNSSASGPTPPPPPSCIE